MTKIYTASEIEKQVWEFERIKIQIPDQKLMFNRRWSEVFRNSLTDREAIVKFRSRYKIFCLACRIL